MERTKFLNHPSLTAACHLLTGWSHHPPVYFHHASLMPPSAPPLHKSNRNANASVRRTARRRRSPLGMLMDQSTNATFVSCGPVSTKIVYQPCRWHLLPRAIVIANGCQSNLSTDHSSSFLFFLFFRSETFTFSCNEVIRLMLCPDREASRFNFLLMISTTSMPAPKLEC